MFEYLIQRENEEMFRVSTRTLAFPDNIERDVEAYRLVWSWFDRLVAYEFGMDQNTILKLALECAEQEEHP